jgi:hypothetical protein
MFTFTKVLKYLFGQWTAEMREDETLCIDNGLMYDSRQTIFLSKEDQSALYAILRDIHGW